MDEVPRAPRRRVLKAGSITFGGSTIDCTVRNVSETGAALEVVSPLYIPDRFTLIVQTDQLTRQCHVAKKSESASRSIDIPQYENRPTSSGHSPIECYGRIVEVDTDHSVAST
jgi:hypothetical protein